MVLGWEADEVSVRAEAVTRRTYNRPLDEQGSEFETWDRTVRRSHYEHHLRLWEEAGGKPNLGELEELNELGRSRAGLVAGRTLWLGGTDYAFSRPASQFNCAATGLSTVYDMVDAFWGLLNGCGMGGLPQSGTLHGYSQPIPQLLVIRSERDKDWRGPKENVEVKPCASNDWTWTIQIGDSAEAWAKALGKMLISPRSRCDKLVIDGSNVRGKGGRLRGYGWICNGFEPLAEALEAVHQILNDAAGNLLDEEQIGDIFNWCGCVLSSRRAAEALMLPSNHPRAAEFSVRKRNYWSNGKKQRAQSNNSLLFWQRPTIDEICDLLYMNLDGGEPGFVNALAAMMKCPWFSLFNPCFEILLARYGFCNLASLCLPMFNKSFARLERAVHVLSRANYRQTCVNLKDGVLQSQWHQTNEALRLCGLSFTGIVQAPWLTDYDLRRLRNAAINGAYSMAYELGTPLPKAVTTIKPEGTRSKISGRRRLGEIAEGMHLPPGEFMVNWIAFSSMDPMAHELEAAGYRTIEKPNDPMSVLVRFPIHYDDCPFQIVDGRKVNKESALSQLRRYRRWNTLFADHNVSATISFSREEVPEMARWIRRNWDKGYIATAFSPRIDPFMTAEQAGHPYLPQEVVTEADWQKMTEGLKPVDWKRGHTGWHDIDESGCAQGVCPVK